MEQKKRAPLTTVRKLIQDTIQRERRGWPPDSNWGAYQPQRPKALYEDKFAQEEE